MVTVSRPVLPQAIGQLVEVVNLVDCHALIGQMQYVVVQMGVGVALNTHHLLDACIAESRPTV